MRKFLYVFLVIGLASCTEGIGIGLDSDVRGSYELYTVNGQRLPYDISTRFGIRSDIIYGTMRLESDGFFTETLEIEEYEFGRVSRYTVRDTGEYETSSRGDVTLYYDGGDRYDAEYVNRELRIYGAGQTIVYRR